MLICNICAFASASEIGALILYSTKLTLGIQKKNWKALSIFLSCLKKFRVKATKQIPFLNNPSFSQTPPFLEKMFHPHRNFLLPNLRTQSPRLGWGVVRTMRNGLRSCILQ